ncbi:FAD-dependent monooxygenase [Blastococcus deserti]|uniref:FAD-dependent monooxygenase n=1 Tax=Blastococcus deserti TaxID=2259033 RepID=A0ABW4X7J2_9ACTN
MLVTNTERTILVVGAGPTGLILACDLLASGVPVRLVDAAAGPATTSRALGLQPRGVEVLERAGGLGDLELRSNPIARVAVHLGSRTAATLDLGRTTRLVTRPGLLVSQAEIEAGLRVRLAELGGRVEWGQEVTDLRQDADGVTTVLGDGSALAADWVVGCDGAHSRVRKLAGIPFPGVQIIERFLLADVHARLPAGRDTVSVFVSGEDMVAAFPLPGEDLWRLMAPAPAGTPDDLDDGAVVDLLTGALRARTGWPPSVVGAAEWTSTFRIHRRLADHYRRGRVLLAGDAAHIHSPVGGQGLNTGIGDAENLAWKLALVAHGVADPVLLDTYEAERRPVAEEVLQSTSALTRMVMGDSLPARLLRDRVFLPALRRAAVQRLIWEQASQLRISYRRGPLAGSRWAAAGRRPRPGDRVADLPCRRPDGSTTRLHAELGSRWALLVPPARSAGEAARIDDHAAAVRHRLGGLVQVLTATGARTRQLLLVRPDAHLFWRGGLAATGPDARLASALGSGRGRILPSSSLPGPEVEHR